MELVEEGITGRLVPPDNSEALAGLIGHLLEHPLERRKLAEAGRDRVAQSFDIKRNLVLDVFKEELLTAAA